MQTSDWHTGRLLVATPEIADGVFFRSVVLMLHHDVDGAQGLILNRPLEADLDAVLPGWGSVATAPARLFQGGPVGLDSALGIVGLGPTDPVAGVRRLFGGVGLVDLDSEPDRIRPEVAAVRVFAGYAGWSAGQLEGEIAEGSWYVVEREAADLFVAEAERLWHDVLARQAGPLALVATFPRDPSLN